MRNAVLFRNDLRVYDNPALSHAMRLGPTIAFYCLTEKQWDIHGDAHAKRDLIIRQLRELEKALSQLNVPLLVLDCGSFDEIPKRLADRATSLGIAKLFINVDYGFNERKTVADLSTQLSSHAIKVHAFHDQCLIEPGLIKTQQGSPFQVFTAFKTAFIKQSHHLRALHSLPAEQAKQDVSSETDALTQYSHESEANEHWPAGENEAHRRLNEFVAERGLRYKDDRDIPSIDGTSSLSPYLTVGILSASQCLRAAMSMNDNELVGPNVGINTWVNELIWRDFYRHLLFSYPDLSRNKPFKSETDHLPWRNDKKNFEAWKTGNTGFPIVDAAMRQLNETAWMHNRLRMITAMFLTKHLFIDWRRGERYFMEMLIDGDLASNNGGWQWSASTGVDAAPYFRIFNPTRQSERFDPQGAFIRRYVPELKSLDSKSIHNPSPEQRLALNYPDPIVDHRSATEDTKSLFKALSASQSNHHPQSKEQLSA